MDALILNSILVGDNSYECGDEVPGFPMKSGREGTRYRYRNCKGRRSDEEFYAVSVSYGDTEQWLALRNAVEIIQRKWLYSSDLHCPIDLTESIEGRAMILQPINVNRFIPIHQILPLQDDRSWQIAIRLFSTVGQIHKEGICLGGFGREQLWVDKTSLLPMLFPGEYMASQSNRNLNMAYRGGYLAVPQKAEERICERNRELTGVHRDIFSAAVISFYLLFCIHPFIGSRFWHLSDEDFYATYQTWPEFIFDQEEQNRLGSQSFEKYFNNRWECVTEELQTLYLQLFRWFTHPESVGSISESQLFDANVWVSVLAENAKQNVFSELSNLSLDEIGSIQRLFV